MSLLIKNARLVDGSGELGTADVLVAEGRIASLSGGDAARVVEAAGKVLTPALTDPHTHLRTPGQEVKEDLASGLRAAARGGYGAVLAMPNTEPALQEPEQVQALLDEARKISGAHLFAAAALTRDQAGERLTPAALLAQAGASLLTDDGHTNEDAGVLARGLIYAGAAGLPVAVHAEDAGLRGGGVMNDGRLAAELGLAGNPPEAEAARVARDLEVLRYAVRKLELLGRRPLLYFQHVSSARSVELIRAARAEGLPVCGEATPHHLTLSEDAWRDFDPLFKVAPPLRTTADVEALAGALEAGDLCAIGTDHAPHTRAEKERDLESAPFGIPSLEVAFALLYTELVAKRGLPLPVLIERMTSGPRRALGLGPARLEVGAPADLMLFDPGLERPVEPEKFVSKARYSPWAGWRLSGWPLLTLVAGKEVWRDAAVA
ncbi:dihydroorotase [Oceanithermus sp.]|uniref:dihydroorotase n=1 Tax=Oceanithermus sp. TaxID=2268145 RepID=UPI0025DEB8FB|nr:dihydroorotase [Oceanithermus sp.]